MTPNEAAKILELDDQATSEEIETRFTELRARLEDKIVKAPTPGLKAKYRGSLDEIAAAFQTLTLAADSSTLPVLQRQRTENGGQKTSKSLSAVGGVPPPREASPKPAAKKSGGGKEFFIVAVIALAVLGAGGWFVLKTRAENAEKARLAAAQEAETKRQADATRLDAERDKLKLEEQAARLRSRLAELDVLLDAALRSESRAEQTLAMLKADLERVRRSSENPFDEETLVLSAKVRALETQVQALRRLLPEHPARAARARAASLIEAAAMTDATAALDELEQRVTALRREIDSLTSDLARIDAETSRTAGMLSRWHRAAAHDELAAYVVAVFGADPTGIPADEAAALNWLLATAKQGNAKAAYLVGVCWIAGRIQGSSYLGYADGHGVILNAANQGNCPEAQVWIGREALGHASSIGLYLLAGPQFQKAAEAGYAEGQYEWGLILSGIQAAAAQGFPANPPAAAQWFGKAAAQGHAAAHYRLGLMYAQGHGVAPNQSTAFDWMRKAAQLGDEDARAYLRKLGRDW